MRFNTAFKTCHQESIHKFIKTNLLSKKAKPRIAFKLSIPPLTFVVCRLLEYLQSRLIVKNLPYNITPERLKNHFSKKGQVTDVKLATTKDGVFRCFGFVGFKTQEQAESALAYFNKSYIDTSRIEVEVAKAIGDASLSRGWSKHTPGTSANTQMINRQKEREFRRLEASSQTTANDSTMADLDPVSKLNSKQKKFLADLQDDPEDPKLKEFLEVMRPRAAAQTRIWGNDDVIAAHRNDHEFVKASVTVPGDEDDELYDELPVINHKDIDIEESATVTEDKEHVDESNIKSTAFDSTMSDMEYMRSKMKKPEEVEMVKIHPSRLAVLEGTGAVDANDIYNIHTPAAPKSEPTQQVQVVEAESDEDDNSADRSRIINSKPIEDELPPAELIADTGRIMVRNLTYLCSPEDIEELFKPFGPISEVHIPIDRETKKSKGYAFIMYLMPENAVNAYTTLDNTIFQGRIMQIVPAKERPKAADETLTGPQTFKKNRETQRKGAASNDFNWNSLFMNADTVAESMAKKLNVRKSDILDKTVDNMAVRLALAETNIINETKAYIEKEGVSIDALKSTQTRSNTVILVKNIPYTTEEEDLIETFGKFGTLGRIILPPAKTIALVEFTERNEAKAAFRKLAYSKFKNIPLYLQWASQGIFTQEFDAEKEAARREARSAAKEISTGHQFNAAGFDSATQNPNVSSKVEHRLEDLEDDSSAPPVASIYIKNLNFQTTEEGLRQAFGGLSGLRSVNIKMKDDPKTGGKQSLGFGFLGFASTEDATKCLKAMQNFKLDNHVLQLKYSKPVAPQKRTLEMDDEDDTIKGTKLVVRNVPFEASKKDIKELFSSFAQVKSVRIPTKYDGQHRGFAFVDFLTKQEAKTAYDTLGATHLYGRHLVLEWAQDDESVEAVRSKTIRNFVKTSTKKQRVEMDDEDDMSQ
ncbi:Multiple RNA-binding domain-containing protein 1 [Batrachochytrium dendrobatidis]|nr:Multiple RNA-binding domain-containing protein 1 [Batrachochytrium dendrobatidis]